MNVGTAKATVTGIGNYTGSLTVTFKIQKKDGQIIAGNKTVNQGSKAINVADRIVTDGKVIITSSAPGIVQVSGNKFIPNADNSCESRKELQGCCGEKDYSYGTPS